MTIEQPHIDPYLFECHLASFRDFVVKKAGVEFVSFASHPYLGEQENYKHEVYRQARMALAFEKWNHSSVGSGSILRATIAAIEIKGNNLVDWSSRYGESKRLHNALYLALDEPSRRRELEACLFQLYRGASDAESFRLLAAIIGSKYALLAYLFFIKDRSRYLPIAPEYFERALGHLGAQFRCSHRCSWENYGQFLTLIKELKDQLEQALETEVALLDAHSFAWILAAQMEKDGKLADVRDYLALSVTERDAIVKARVGQGQFRQRLLEYWSTCAVTGCAEDLVLRASHIKPWSKSSLVERLSLYNGLLLSPALDACFDSGLITFDDSGRVLISTRLRESDVRALYLHTGMQLRKLVPEHRVFLAYHRQSVYK